MAGSSRKVIYAALVGNTLIAITKFAAAAFTGSSAMLSEGIHSTVDSGNQLLLLHGLRRAAKPPDRRFPFGHGKEIYFWSFIVAILIFAVGSGISIYEGIHRLQHPGAIERPLVNYVVLGLAMVFESVAWLIAFREFSKARGRWGYIEAVRRGKDPTLFVVLFEDSAAMLGLVAAFAGVALSHATGNTAYDALASLVIGAILAGTAIWLAWETKSLLIGESAAGHVIDGIRNLVEGQPDVERVNEVLTMHMGPDYILLNISAEFRHDASMEALERSIAAMDRAIKETFPEVKRVFIEAERLRRPSPPGP